MIEGNRSGKSRLFVEEVDYGRNRSNGMMVISGKEIIGSFF